MKGLYEELHTFKNDIEFLDMGFSRAGPYYAWMEAVEAHQDANPGWVLFDELGFAANEVLMLGMNYMDEDPGASDLSAIEFFETKIQAGLAAKTSARNAGSRSELRLRSYRLSPTSPAIASWSESGK